MNSDELTTLLHPKIEFVECDLNRYVTYSDPINLPEHKKILGINYEDNVISQHCDVKLELEEDKNRDLLPNVISCQESVLSVFSLVQPVQETNLQTCKSTKTKRKVKIKRPPRNKQMHCNICNYKTTRSCNLNRHKLIHFQATEFFCYLCDYWAPMKKSLKQHIASIHVNKKPLFCTAMCGYVTTDKHRLKRHVHTHSEEKQFACYLCGYETVRKWTLRRHMLIHFDQKLFLCNVCSFTTKCGESLKEHRSTHIGTKKEVIIFSCGFCNYKSKKKFNLLRHGFVHAQSKTYFCHLCNFKTFHKSKLALHIRGTHIGEKPFVCIVCEYSTVDRNALKRHVLIHVCENPYACSLCGYTSVRRGDLNTHMWVHKGNKPYLCNHCEFGTTKKCRLIAHLNIHSVKHCNSKGGESAAN